MSDAYIAVIVLSIAALVIGALVFGGSFLVYNLGNRQVRPGDDGSEADATDRGRTTTPKHP